MNFQIFQPATDGKRVTGPAGCWILDAGCSMACCPSKLASPDNVAGPINMMQQCTGHEHWTPPHTQTEDTD